MNDILFIVGSALVVLGAAVTVGACLIVAGRLRDAKSPDYLAEFYNDMRDDNAD